MLVILKTYSGLQVLKPFPLRILTLDLAPGLPGERIGTPDCLWVETDVFLEIQGELAKVEDL
jgi:hypothetical protein